MWIGNRLAGFWQLELRKILLKISAATTQQWIGHDDT